MRRRWLWLPLACLLQGCVIAKPPVVTPPVVETPQVITRAFAVVVSDGDGHGLPGAVAKIDDIALTSNGDGYVLWPALPLGAHTLTLSREGFLPASLSITLTAETEDMQVLLERLLPPSPTDEEFHHILANFCNLRDSQGRVIFSAFHAALGETERREWLRIQVAAGSTHIVVSPFGGYAGSPIPTFSLLESPETFAEVIREILATPGANGKALTPIIILDDGSAGIAYRIRTYWPGIRAALGADADHVIVVPGWELVAASEASSADLSFALTTLHQLDFPHIWVHLSPGRASGASNPVKPDDPWQGAESGFWKSNGGEFIEGLLYQSRDVRREDDTCDPADEACWLNRWEDVVPRLGNGMNGWRIVHLTYFEGPAYWFYRGEIDSAFAIRIADAAQRMCQKYFVVCGFGNGLPTIR